MTAITLVFVFVLVLLVGMMLGWLVCELVHNSTAGTQHPPAAPTLPGASSPAPGTRLDWWPGDASAPLGTLEFGGGVIHRPVSAEPSGWPLGEFTPGSDCEILLVGRDLESDREDLRTWALATVKFVFTQTFDGRPRFICEKWGGFGLVMVDPDEIRPKGGASATI